MTGSRPEGDSLGGMSLGDIPPAARAVRWGVVSTARINEKLLAGARAAAGVDVVAVGSRGRARGEEFAARHGIGRVHGSYEDLLADPDVEAVYIPLPNSLHVPWSIKALEAGKHVLCEKPLTRRAAEVEQAFDAAERAGRILMEGFMWRYHDQTDALVRLAAEIAPLRVVRACFGFSLPAADTANVRLQADLDGGALMDVGCYCVSALRLLCGEPERVTGEAVARAGVDGRFAGVLRFASGVLGIFDCGFDVPPRGAIEVVGEGGTLVAEDPWHGVAPRLTLTRPRAAPEEITIVVANPYARELEDVSAAIRSGGAPRLGRADAVGQARTIEALYAAAGAGRSVGIG
jgi:D-xylose 1-dehydrogenase (NADP+, D-xylono-1,5-lactone-forming)